ncbi:MAG: glycosyltransferase [Pyrinomonadaceae bacterium]|nr:glycosyltransferase [Pyrinomonadaceae bacterium]
MAPRVCWPLDTGAKLRNYHLARVLSEKANVTLLAFADSDAPPVNPENHYERVVTVKRDPGYTPAKILRGALGRTPISVLNYTTDAMKRALARMLSEQDFDVVQIESIHLMGYLSIIRSTSSRPLVVCDWHNIESELMTRYSEREPNFLRRIYARKTAHQLRALEQQSTRDFDAHVVVSDRDRNQLLQLNSASFVSVIENGVDSAYYSDQEIEKAYAAWRVQRAAVSGLSQSPIGANRIVFVGSMDYHANIHAVADFARDVWPVVLERHPELVFTIVGRDPGEEVRQLASIPGIEVTGTVGDVRPYYREAVASIVPLKVGGGSRLKILESMAAGVPVVSTTLGAEGLEVRHGADIVIGDTKEQLVEAITRLLQDEELRRQLSEAGRDLVSRRYEWEIAGESLFRIYEDLVTDRTRGKN